MGARFTGVLSVGVMVVGIGIKYYAIQGIDPARMVDFWFFGARSLKLQVLTASLGYALFAVGYEIIGITANKIVVRWFRGKELAFALGMNVALRGSGLSWRWPFRCPLRVRSVIRSECRSCSGWRCWWSGF